MRKKKDVDLPDLGNTIIEGIQEKKGRNIINIDLRELNNSVCEYFVISHGDSNTQVRAIAENIEQKVKKILNLNVYHREGYENARWILLDYNTIIIHIFQEETRRYYRLEELWADGKFTILEDIE
jgi:ribosome-associated protein